MKNLGVSFFRGFNSFEAILFSKQKSLVTENLYAISFEGLIVEEFNTAIE